MMITKQIVGDKLLDYLNRNVTLTELVDWAENVLLDDEIAEADIEVVREVIARLGLADVREFGLSWEDCYDFLSQLGYAVHVQAEAIPGAA